MSWVLSRFRAGQLVEVRDKEEILATLDENGCLEGLPFMPEMLQFCGQRFRVRAVAHKTCETARQTWKTRRLKAAVHLADLRCDGSAHGGCQAACTLFWKDAWLKTTADDRRPVPALDKPGSAAAGCSEAQLRASTENREAPPGEEPCYACQATRLYNATEPIVSWDPRQYWFDAWTGNHSVARVLRVTWLASLRWMLRGRVPCGYRVFRSFTEWMHRLLTGRAMPSLSGQVKPGDQTPVGRLDLQQGEFVRIKSKAEIEATLDRQGNNRGLSFDAEEMAPYCGGVFRVRSVVTRIVDELAGTMRHMKQPCIILEGVVCNSEYAACRLNCPRAIPSYWREIWLERLESPEPRQDMSIVRHVEGAATEPRA